MRSEFYGDRRDLWKWTIALREASSGRKILHVAMLRPPKRPRKKPPGVDDRVWDFFAKEWTCLDSEASRCSRIAHLSDQIQVISDRFDSQHRGEYFANIAAALLGRSSEQRFVVLLDPDTGIAASKGTNEHICQDDIGTIWKEMRSNDVLLIYQHNARMEMRAWIAKKKELLARATGQPISHIKDHAHSDVCFFVVEK